MHVLFLQVNAVLLLEAGINKIRIFLKIKRLFVVDSCDPAGECLFILLTPTGEEPEHFVDMLF